MIARRSKSGDGKHVLWVDARRVAVLLMTPGQRISVRELIKFLDSVKKNIEYYSHL